MKEAVEQEYEKTWTHMYNQLPLFMRIKTKDLCHTVVSSMYDVCSNLTYLLSCMVDHKDEHQDLEMDPAIMDWFSDVRKSTIHFKQSMRDKFEQVAGKYCSEKDKQAVHDLFSHKKNETIKKRWKYEDNRDIRKKVEDILMVILPHSFRSDHIPDNRSLDFKTAVSMLEDELSTFESWFRVKSETIKNQLKLSVKDMTKYLELDNLVREKNEVLNRLSHLPISVRTSIPNSILLSEKQFNMLNNYELHKKVIVTSAMITKLEMGVDDNSIYVGGVGTFISKYSVETKQIMLASEKSRRESRSLLLQRDAHRQEEPALGDRRQEERPHPAGPQPPREENLPGPLFRPYAPLTAEGGFVTTEVICMNPEKSNIYWFRGKGMISRIDCNSLDKEDYEISVTSSLP